MSKKKSTKKPDFLTTDANVESVRAKLASRAAVGLKKYGVTTERKDLSRLDWLNHLQQELMDACVYLEVQIHEEENKPVAKKPEFAADQFTMPLIPKITW